MNIHNVRLTVLLLAIVLALSSCAALQPLSTSGPRENEARYPIVLTEDSHRREAMVVALNRLAQRSGVPNATESQPKLQPVTATILSLPPNTSRNLYLPKVGAAIMNEEETRESLRRFITQSQQLIGADPAKLSLVERIDQPDGTKLANYEQRPFRYPIRGNYGKLQISFRSDRRIVDLTSTCIPDADRIQTAISALNVRPRAEDTVQKIRANGLAFTDANGKTVDFKLPPAAEITPQKLVIYILPSKDNPDALEFHLAWELTFGTGPIKTAFVDALTGEVVAAE